MISATTQAEVVEWLTALYACVGAGSECAVELSVVLGEHRASRGPRVWLYRRDSTQQPTASQIEALATDIFKRWQTDRRVCGVGTEYGLHSRIDGGVSGRLLLTASECDIASAKPMVEPARTRPFELPKFLAADTSGCGALAVLIGPRRLGKTTFLLQVADMLATRESPILFCAVDEPLGALSQTAQRLGIHNANILIRGVCVTSSAARVTARDVLDICTHENTHPRKPHYLFVDSLNPLAEGRVDRARGALRALYAYAMQSACVVIVTVSTPLTRVDRPIFDGSDPYIVQSLDAQEGPAALVRGFRRLMTCVPRAQTELQYLEMTERGLVVDPDARVEHTAPAKRKKK